MRRHWPSGPEVRRRPLSGGEMLYDASRAGNAEESWLDAAWWSLRGRVAAAARGRVGSYFIAADGRDLLLRHYRRGGLLARWQPARFRWRSADDTCSFVEWHLLYLMHRRGLPVPVPLAARYRRAGHSYTADILMERLPDTRSLVSVLGAAPLPITTWVQIGRCIRRFHVSGVCHADLRAHHVLLDASHQVWLVGFDRAQLKPPGMWSDANLTTLYRSIEKAMAGMPSDRFAAADWSSLLDGYFAEAVELDLLSEMTAS